MENNRAVFNQRLSGTEGLDFFPTPPWATRALMEHVLTDNRRESVLDPCAGAGHMAVPLSEYFDTVVAFDIRDYGYPLGFVGDYKGVDLLIRPQWIIMNPPFNQAEHFVHKARVDAEYGVAILVRTNFLESSGRFETLFSVDPPTTIAQFAERVPMVEGRYDPKASTATSYCWVVWEQTSQADTRFVWIPPCREKLFRAGDVDIYNPIV